MASNAENNNNNNDEFISTKKLLEISQYLYNNYYSKPYKQSPPTGSSEAIKQAWHVDLDADHGIERPNHALAHSMRKAFLVPIVIDTFKKYCKMDKSKFNFSGEEIFALQVALLFESVGRESDISYSTSPELHNQFDKNSYKVYKAYYKKNMPEQLQTAFRASYIALKNMYNENKTPHMIILETCLKIFFLISLIPP